MVPTSPRLPPATPLRTASSSTAASSASRKPFPPERSSPSPPSATPTTAPLPRTLPPVVLRFPSIAARCPARASAFSATSCGTRVRLSLRSPRLQPSPPILTPISHISCSTQSAHTHKVPPRQQLRRNPPSSRHGHQRGVTFLRRRHRRGHRTRRCQLLSRHQRCLRRRSPGQAFQSECIHPLYLLEQQHQRYAGQHRARPGHLQQHGLPDQQRLRPQHQQHSPRQSQRHSGHLRHLP